MRAAREEAALKDAAKFSPLTGGLLLSKKFGAAQLDLGIWPKLEMLSPTPVRDQGIRLKVDLLRINW